MTINNTPALTAEHAERIEFEEDVSILDILRTKVFRHAIQAHLHGALELDLGPELVDDDNDVLTEAWTELDEARDGKCAVSAEIKKWRLELDGDDEAGRSGP
jgi:hypothetical protein